MAIEPRSVLEDLRLTAVDGFDGRFHVRVDDGWRVLHVFGGMTTALALAAAKRALGRPDLKMISSQATFVAPVGAGGVTMQTEVIRSGRRGAQVSVRLWSGDDPTSPTGADLLVDVVFGQSDDALPTLQRVQMPADAKSPEESIARHDVRRSAALDIPFHAQTDWRLAVGPTSPDEPPSDSRSISWFRFLRSPIDESGAWDPAALAVPGDILGPAVAGGIGGGQQFFVITLQLSLQWFAELTTEWVCQHATVVRGSGGFVTGIADLWSEDGELVGFATQVAMLRPFERVAADGLGGSETQG